MEYQIHYDRKFYIDKKTGYWISTDYPRVRAHIWVWTYYNGKPKKGFHIHHVDEDKSNNEIDNLREISATDHVDLHMTEERRQMSRKWAEIIRPLTKEWHASEEGHKWHSDHAKVTFKRDHPIGFLCECCHKRFIVDAIDAYKTRFCSNKCKAKFRRDSGVDNVEITCEYCGKKIIRNKYAKTRFCSHRCARFGSKDKVDKESGKG